MASGQDSSANLLLRCPKCDSELRTFRGEQYCEQCGYRTPGFDNLEILTPMQKQFREALDNPPNAVVQGIKEAIRAIYGFSEDEQRVLEFRRKHPTPAPSNATTEKLPDASEKSPAAPRADSPKQSTTEKQLFIEAEKLHSEGKSWAQIAQKLTPEDVKDKGITKARERLRQGVKRLKEKRSA